MSAIHSSTLQSVQDAVAELREAGVRVVFYGDSVDLYREGDEDEKFFPLSPHQVAVANKHVDVLSQIGKSPYDFTQDYSKLGYNVEMDVTDDGHLVFTLQDRRYGTYAQATDWIPKPPEGGPRDTRIVFDIEGDHVELTLTQ